jgi:TonB family protein
MRKTFLSILVICSFITLQAQNSDTIATGDSIVLPKYAKGELVWNAYVKSHLQTNYPDSARKNSVEGIVKVSFKVNKDSSISDVHVLYDCCPEYEFNLTAISLLHAAGKWIPGKVNGIDTVMKVVIPIDFKLEERIFQIVETSAEFPGGQSQMMRFVQKNVNYPEMARENDISGRVIVQFVVEKDGSISNVKTVGAVLGFGLEEEAMRVVKRMPKWTPGEQRGKKVRMRFHLPIRFELM